MTITTDEVFQAAFDLPSDERKELVDRLLDTLPGTEADEVTAAWKAEVERRIQAIEDGSEKLISADEVFASLQQGR